MPVLHPSEIWKAAAERGELSIKVESYAAGVRFRQKLYMERTRQQKAEIAIAAAESRLPRAPYAGMYIQIRDGQGNSVKSKADAGAGPFRLFIGSDANEVEIDEPLPEALDDAALSNLVASALSKLHE